MNQLTLSFHDEILLQLKAKNWEFKSRPDSLNKITGDNKFIKLDRSNPDVNPGSITKRKSLRKDKR